MHYHISKKNLGISPTLTARIPDGTCVVKESPLPRVCFAPTLERCLMGVTGCARPPLWECISELGRLHDGYFSNPSVYATLEELIKPPQNKSDFKRTGEMWSLNDIQVIQVGYLCLQSLSIGVVALTWNRQTLVQGDYLKKRREGLLDRAAL